MKEQFKTLFFVKSSLISLYLALTIPIPFFANKELKIVSIILFVVGLIMINEITSDCVETCDKKVSFKTSHFSNFFGKKRWEIFWNDVALIKSMPTSQGSKVFYFATKNDENYLVPQRIEKISKFVSIISIKTGLKVDELSYISPLWTYKLLTLLSVFMIIGEIIAFII